MIGLRPHQIWHGSVYAPHENKPGHNRPRKMGGKNCSVSQPAYVGALRQKYTGGWVLGLA